MSPSLHHLRELPFPAQVAAIDAELATGNRAPLLRELSSYRDYQPLAYALASLADANALKLDAATMGDLLEIPDTGLRRVLRALDEVRTPAAFSHALADGAWKLPVERIAAVAMIDRWLKNTVPQDRRARAAAGLATCQEKIANGAIDSIADSHLMRLPGTQLAALDELAHSAGCLDAWQERQSQFAKQILDVLESQPKSLSQANAEELLSRQVYTDPGHFLVELLQNADDAGADRWHVQVFEDRIEVTHNGTPFDPLDVVGILSIGQTTKSKEQIGFFGVGFKSVYEICERPQLYSGVFNLEIADVSIPRPLRPLENLPNGHTRLVLPLRQGRDESVSPERLFQTLAELPAEVVLTLNSVRELDLRFGKSIRHVRGSDEPDGRFRIDDGDHCKRYLVERTEAAYEGSRGMHRASRTPVLVAVPLNDDGIPTPSKGAPTIYSYLPTHERSGLRVLVHAHFDLPVDRERIDLSSEWNQWALAQAGTLLANIVARLCEEQREGVVSSGAALDAMLSIVSLPGELNHHAFEALASTLPSLAFLHGADGKRYSATCALLCEDARLREAFAGVALQGERHLLREHGGRDADVAAWLGASQLEMSAIVDAIARHAAEGTAGDPFEPPWSLKLASVLEALGDAAVSLEAMQDVPCLPDASGRAQFPRDLHRAARELRGFLSHVHPLVREDLESAGCSSVLDALGLTVSTVRDLVALCGKLQTAERLIERVGAPALIRFFQAAAPAELEYIAFACIVPNDQSSLSPVGEVWCTGTSALATFIRKTEFRPPLVDRETEKLLEPSLRSIGCRSLDISAMLTCIGAGSLRIAEGSLQALHTALDTIAQDIAPNVAKRLALAPIFPSRGDGPLPLLGDRSASIPHDEDITELWPARPWLTQAVASLPYIRSLGAPIIGPEALAATLLAPAIPKARRQIFAYLTRHAESLSSLTAGLLARAPLWPDVHGTLHPLDSLRRTAERASVAALYKIWPQAVTVEPTEAPGSALHLATALHLEHRVAAPDLATAIADLRNTSAIGSGPYRSSGELDLKNPQTEGIVYALLNDAAEALPRTILKPICEAPIFLCNDGERRRLGSAHAPLKGRALRVSGFLVAAFESLGFSILDQRTIEALQPLLDGLQLRPATLIDLVRETSTGEGALHQESATQFRRALCSDTASLAALDDVLRGELSKLAIWPCQGALVAAQDVVRGRELEALLADAGLGGLALGKVALLRLDPSVELEAETLSAYLTFASPVHLLADSVTRVAKEGEAISAQVELLSSIETIARLAAVLAAHHPTPWSLPISVNAANRLVARPLLLATADELLACAGLDLADELANADWAKIAAADASEPLEALTPRRLLDAMREVSSTAEPATSHATLYSAEARDAFYRWLLLHSKAIADDAQSLGLLGTSAVILSEMGVLRTPRELLFDRTLPDLGIDWNASQDVAESLQHWLQGCFRPASKQLRPIVDHMIEAIDTAAEASDGARIASVLEHLARLLRADRKDNELEELAKRFKLRKRLRVETQDGQFEFARRLLAAEPLDVDLVPRFAVEPPASAAHKYREPRILRLLRASGAEDELGIAALRSFLGGTGRCPGSDSDIAFACYLGSAANRQASLRNDLDLRREPWLPNALGALNCAAELYWPTPELETLIGRDESLYVHPEFILRVPDAREWLPVRDVENATLANIATFLSANAALGEPASANALVWLDAQLAENRLNKKEVHGALAGVAMLVDDHGKMRRAPELLVSGGRRLFGERRGNWSAGTRLRHLAEALEISRRPQASDVLRFFAQVHREYEAQPDAVQRDASVLEALPRALDALIELGGRGPQTLPVTALRGSESVFVILPSKEVSIGLPQQLEETDLVLRLPDGADLYAWQRFMRGYGIGPVEEDAIVVERVVAPTRLDAIEDAPLQHRREEAEEESEGAGVISRLRSWLRGNEDEPDTAPGRPASDARGSRSQGPEGASAGARSGQSASSDAEPPPFRPIDQRGWFGGESPLSTQLASNPSWLADRMQSAEFGLAHSPHQLPVPHRYAPNAIFSDFDRRRQQWKPLRCETEWREGGAPAGRLHMRGKLPSPEARIPMPLYGRLVDAQTTRDARVVEGRDAVALLSKNDPTVSFTFDLSASPNFSEATKGGELRSMLEPVVADRELPEEVLDLVESLRREDSALQIASVIRSFVRKRYVYDPSYLEDPQMAAWLQERSAGRSNVHIAALHAGGDVDTLGRGVCYELNTLVCEMLRRAGVQAAVATGWTFDRGHIDEPDHLWAMALMQTSLGPRWLPIDASTTQNGRPLHAAHRPPGPWRADKRKARPLQEPAWDTIEHKERAVEALPLGDLLRVARYLETATGRHLGTRGEILAACREILSNPEKRVAFTALLGLEPRDDLE
tara:strand:+ start:126999 stop:134162 length:7164 start_codon:yes stop_codon:yes gene_type:complete